MQYKHPQKNKKKTLKWVEGKQASNYLEAVGFKNASQSAKKLKQGQDNDLIQIDQEKEIEIILKKDRSRKGYGMRGDGATDSEGRVPLILKVENLYNQYEVHKAKIREMELFKHCQSKTVHKNYQSLIRKGLTDTKEFEMCQNLEDKYADFRLKSSNQTIDVQRQFRLRKFTKHRSSMNHSLSSTRQDFSSKQSQSPRNNNIQQNMLNKYNLASIEEQGSKLKLDSLVKQRNTFLNNLNLSQQTSQVSLKNQKNFMLSRNLSQDKSYKSNHRYSFAPTTQEIMQIETTEEFNDFYKRIKPKHIDNINVKKDIDDYVRKKVETRKGLIGKNLVAQKMTKSLDIRRSEIFNPMISKFDSDIRQELNTSPYYKSKIDKLELYKDQSYDSLEHDYKTLQAHATQTTSLRRKMLIQRQKDKAECIGYLLADHENPQRKISFTIDAVNFPMTTKYHKKKFLNANYDKPPLPISVKQNSRHSIIGELSNGKNQALKDRIISACTEYDTQNKKKF
eukprot:403363470